MDTATPDRDVADEFGLTREDIAAIQEKYGPGHDQEAEDEPFNLDDLLDGIDTSLLGVRVSKHRKGRTPPLTTEQRRKRDRRGRLALRASKSVTEDAKALARAAE